MSYSVGDLILLPQSGWVEVIKITDGFMTVRPANKQVKKFETLAGKTVEFQSNQSNFYISVNSEAIKVKKSVASHPVESDQFDSVGSEETDAEQLKLF